MLIKNRHLVAKNLKLTLVAATIAITTQALAASSTDEKDKKIEHLTQQVSELRTRLERLENLLQASATSSTTKENTQQTSVATNQHVSLDDDEYATITEASNQGAEVGDFISSRWYENFDISGFAAASYLNTGTANNADYHDGAFGIQEATIFVEADVWENVAVFFELQTNRLGDDGSKYVRTGEVYLHLRDIFPQWQDSKMGAKAGRMDIPFGEEYLYQDAIDNPLVSTSVAWPYGWDEGLLFYGKYQGLGWAAAIMDGTDSRSKEDDPSKAYNIKLWGNPVDALYLSASFMHNGNVGKSAIEFAGSHFQPVTANSASAGSDSKKVESWLYELDAKYSFGDTGADGHLWLSYGYAEQDDDNNLYDRDFSWLVIEPLWYLTDSIYVAGRYSNIGTDDNLKGYHFDGKTTANGNSTFGYDVKNLERISVGLGWWLNQKTNIKLEYSKDHFELIEQSTIAPNNGDRDLVAVEIAAKF